jgi:hypothetical protein
MLKTEFVRFFRGSETSQVHGHTGAPAEHSALYFEPPHYDGDVLYSAPYATVAEVVAAAVDALALTDGPWLDEITTEVGWEGRVARELCVVLEPEAERAAGREAAEILARVASLPGGDVFGWARKTPRS